tara:strand:+ start:664 stop:1191 length:528 start_codon:yes stop_codon:yes gene_type:complete
MIKLQDILNEDRFDQSKMFDDSSLKKIADEIKKMVKWEKGYQASFDYSEYRFGDGTGGFAFKWLHNRNKGGSFGLTLNKNGKHSMYCYSYYGKHYTGIESSPGKYFKFKGNPVVWRDFNNDHLLEIWKKSKSMITKNEKGANAALDKEAKAQAAYYGNKSDTGRIGYGLSSQPRR